MVPCAFIFTYLICPRHAATEMMRFLRKPTHSLCGKALTPFGKEDKVLIKTLLDRRDITLCSLWQNFEQRLDEEYCRLLLKLRKCGIVDCSGRQRIVRTDEDADIIESLVPSMNAESSFFVGLRHLLWVKVGHRLLNLCDCDNVLSEWCRQTNSPDFFKKNKNNVGLLFLKQVKTGTAYVEFSFWQDADSESVI